MRSPSLTIDALFPNTRDTSTAAAATEERPLSTTVWMHLLTGLLIAFSGEETQDLTIAGYWTLNHELSDQASSVPETANPESAKALLSELLALHEHLTVAPTGQGTITIVEGHGISRVYDTADARSYRHSRRVQPKPGPSGRDHGCARRSSCTGHCASSEPFSRRRIA